MVSHIVFLSLFLLQTFQKEEETDEAECEPSADEKRPLVHTNSRSSLKNRKTTRGSSFAVSEADKEETEKLDEEKLEEVSCAATSLGFGWMGQHGLCRLFNTLADIWTKVRSGLSSFPLQLSSYQTLAIALCGLNGYDCF